MFRVLAPEKLLTSATKKTLRFSKIYKISRSVGSKQFFIIAEFEEILYEDLEEEKFCNNYLKL